MPFNWSYPEEEVFALERPSTAERRWSTVAEAASINKEGGVYRNGSAFSLEKKVEVSLVYKQMLVEGGNKPVSERALARAARISPPSAKKIMAEVNGDGITDPKDRVRELVRGKGAKTFSTNDEVVLLRIRKRCNKMTLKGYQLLLFRTTGTLASTSTISKWFRKRFQYRDGLKKPNMVPMDKYKEDNI
jgi:hypothetical protein